MEMRIKLVGEEKDLKDILNTTVGLAAARKLKMEYHLPEEVKYKSIRDTILDSATERAIEKLKEGTNGKEKI